MSSLVIYRLDDRLPVKTFTYSYNENLINEAIQRESLRGGQVYYLCNDLNLIGDRRLRLLDKFPNLKIEVVHGHERLQFSSWEIYLITLICGRLSNLDHCRDSKLVHLLNFLFVWPH